MFRVFILKTLYQKRSPFRTEIIWISD